MKEYYIGCLHYSVLHLFLSHTHLSVSRKYYLLKSNSMLCCLQPSKGNTLLVRQVQIHCRAHKPNYHPIVTHLLYLSLYNLEIPDYCNSSMHSVMNHACCFPLCFHCLQLYKPWPCWPILKTQLSAPMNPPWTPQTEQWALLVDPIAPSAVFHYRIDHSGFSSPFLLRRL